MMNYSSLKEISIADILGGDGPENHHGARMAVLNYVRQNPDGVTTKAVEEAVGLDYHRAYSILKELCLEREIYSRKVRGIKFDLYYPNGKLIHKYLQESKDIGGQTFRITFHEGKRRPRIQIQERQYTLLEGEKVQGSIFVDVDNAENLIDFFQEMLIKFNQFEKSMLKEK